MGKIKDENFDEMVFRKELVKVYKELENHPIVEEFSPIVLAKSLYGKFNLNDEDVLMAIKMYYNFE
jgi:hypothetical protein